jgi:hypothetical protein
LSVLRCRNKSFIGTPVISHNIAGSQRTY